MANQEKTNSGGGKKGKSKCWYRDGNHKRKECNKLKLALEKQGNCPHCDKSGHLESECFVKHPNKKPSWFGKKKQGGGETSNSNLEIQVVNLDYNSKDFA